MTWAGALSVLTLATTAMLALPCLTSARAETTQASEPATFHGEPYRAPVPATLTGAAGVVTTETARQAWETGETAFIDVLPHAPKPANLPDGTLWRDLPRHSIPGALWLPNVGYEAIAAETDAYFRRGLAAATGGEPTHPVLFFCLAECWMSWNAAKRAIEYGYTQVYWYPEGTDGWTQEGLPTEPVLPAELP